ncbi:MAG: T9SS type A sorting domain-containing protein [Rhodothermales bacterium]
MLKIQATIALFLFFLPYRGYAQSDPPQAFTFLSDQRVTDCPSVRLEGFDLLYGLATEPSGFALAEVRDDDWNCGSSDTLAAYIRRYDSQGDLLEQIPLPFSSQAALAITGAEGGFYFVAESEGQVTASWVTTGGEIEWAVEIPGLTRSEIDEVWPLRGGGLTPTTEGILIGTGRYSSSDPRLFHIGAGGALEWVANLGGVFFYNYVNSLTPALMTPDGGAMLVMAVEGGASKLYAVRVDSEGGIDWTRTYEPPAIWGNPSLDPSVTRVLSDGRFLVVGSESGLGTGTGSPTSWRNLFALVLDPGGSVAWWNQTGRRSDGERHQRAHSAVLTEDGKVRIVSEFLLPQESPAPPVHAVEEVLLDLQTSGLQRAPTLSPNSSVPRYFGGTRYTQTPGGPWVSAKPDGRSHCHPTFGCEGNRELHLIMVEERGEIETEDPPVPEDEDPPVLEDPPAMQLAAYPNPLWNQATVEGKGEFVEVFDVLGRRVLSTTSPPVGAVRIDFGALAPGIYMIRRGEEAISVTVR